MKGEINYRQIVGYQGETPCCQGRNLLLLGKPLIAKEEITLLPKKKPLVTREETDVVTMETDKMTKSIDTTKMDKT